MDFCGTVSACRIDCSCHTRIIICYCVLFTPITNSCYFGSRAYKKYTVCTEILDVYRTVFEFVGVLAIVFSNELSLRLQYYAFTLSFTDRDVQLLQLALSLQFRMKWVQFSIRFVRCNLLRSFFFFFHIVSFVVEESSMTPFVAH